eukprot:tig00021504_g21970.t1
MVLNAPPYKWTDESRTPYTRYTYRADYTTQGAPSALSISANAWTAPSPPTLSAPDADVGPTSVRFVITDGDASASGAYARLYNPANATFELQLDASVREYVQHGLNPGDTVSMESRLAQHPDGSALLSSLSNRVTKTTKVPGPPTVNITGTTYQSATFSVTLAKDGTESAVTAVEPPVLFAHGVTTGLSYAYSSQATVIYTYDPAGVKQTDYQYYALALSSAALEPTSPRSNLVSVTTDNLDPPSNFVAQAAVVSGVVVDTSSYGTFSYMLDDSDRAAVAYTLIYRTTCSSCSAQATWEGFQACTSTSACGRALTANLTKFTVEFVESNLPRGFNYTYRYVLLLLLSACIPIRAQGFLCGGQRCRLRLICAGDCGRAQPAADSVALTQPVALAKPVAFAQPVPVPRTFAESLAVADTPVRNLPEVLRYTDPSRFICSITLSSVNVTTRNRRFTFAINKTAPSGYMDLIKYVRVYRYDCEFKSHATGRYPRASVNCQSDNRNEGCGLGACGPSGRKSCFSQSKCKGRSYLVDARNGVWEYTTNDKDVSPNDVVHWSAKCVLEDGREGSDTDFVGCRAGGSDDPRKPCGSNGPTAAAIVPPSPFLRLWKRKSDSSSKGNKQVLQQGLQFNIPQSYSSSLSQIIVKRVECDDCNSDNDEETCECDPSSTVTITFSASRTQSICDKTSCLLPLNSNVFNGEVISVPPDGMDNPELNKNKLYQYMRVQYRSPVSI